MTAALTATTAAAAFRRHGWLAALFVRSFVRSCSLQTIMPIIIALCCVLAAVYLFRKDRQDLHRRRSRARLLTRIFDRSCTPYHSTALYGRSRVVGDRRPSVVVGLFSAVADKLPLLILPAVAVVAAASSIPQWAMMSSVIVLLLL